jgi:kynureninase
VEDLARDGVIGDFRPPDVIRLGFAALYLRFVDGFAAAERLVAVTLGRPPSAAGSGRRPAAGGAG